MLMVPTGNPGTPWGEIHEYDLKKWATYYGKALDGLHMPFNFALLNTPWEAKAMRSLVDALEAAVPEGAWPNYVLGNHDDQRLLTRVGPDAARVGAMLLLTLRGTPTLYYGDEIGMAEAVIPQEMVQDPWGITVPGLSRDVVVHPCSGMISTTPGSQKPLKHGCQCSRVMNRPT